MTTLTVDTARDRLLGELEAGRSYAFLTLAEPHLEAHVDDHYVRLMAVREYLKLSLVAPARELLGDGLATTDWPADLQTIRNAVEGLKGDALDWAVDDACYQANLDALSKRGVDVASIQSAWRARSDSFQRWRDNLGLTHLRVRDAEGRWRWFPTLGDQVKTAESQPLPDGCDAGMPGPFSFEGLGQGTYFRRVYQATLDTFLGYSCALYVVEPDPAALAMALHLHDWGELLADDRIHWFIGPQWEQDFRQTFDDDLDLAFPVQSLQPAGRAFPGVVDVIEKAINQRQRAVDESMADLDRRYADRDMAYWSRRFEAALSGRGDPLRILAGVSTHTTFLQYSMRDAKRAFESLGHTCVVLTEKTPHHVIGALTYHNAMRDLDPDLFFNIDHLRPEFGAVVPANLPILTWDQDQLPTVFTVENMSRIGPLDFITGWSKNKCVQAGVDPAQCLYSGVPTSPEQFSGPPLTDEERDRYACDISYVSHASQTPQAFHDQERRTYDDQQYRSLLDSLYELTVVELHQHGVLWGGMSRAILDNACQRCGVVVQDKDLRDRLLGWYLWRLADRIFRHEALNWVADWAKRGGRSLRIYGRGWDEHPTLSAFAAGPAHNGRELLCVYRASKINLQLMPAGFAHQRSLDGLAAGGFFLSRLTSSDRRGATLTKLAARIDELNIITTRALLAHSDDLVQRLLNEYIGEWRHSIDPDSSEFVNIVRFTAETAQPADVFPRFSEILFDSAESFARSADRFLLDDSARDALATEMREVVMENYTYEPTMQRFLTAMSSYFQGASA